MADICEKTFVSVKATWLISMFYTLHMQQSDTDTLHKWERDTDAIPTKLQVIWNLTPEGKEIPSKEILCPFGCPKTKVSMWDSATDQKNCFVADF